MDEPKTKSVVVTPASQRIKNITMDEPKPTSISTERMNAPSTPPRKRIKVEEPRMSIAITNATTTTANESIVVTPSPPQTKISTDDGDKTQQPLFALESFAALQASDPNWVHTLILGTMPSKKSFAENLSPKEIQLRGGSGRQIYGNSQNVFWNIVGSALGFQRHQTPFREQVQRLTDLENIDCKRIVFSLAL